MPHQAKVVTVSDSVHATSADDRTGPALVDLLKRSGFVVSESRVVPDDVELIKVVLLQLADGFSGLIVTTGGTGFAPRDVTPEATYAALDREAPGLAEAMRAVSPLGRLSRGVAGTVGASLILNTPGSKSGAIDCLTAVLDVIPHALDLLSGADPHPQHKVGQ